ncbi:UNVERIFIED_CONTAM: hypothetical protein FKN15_036729 [Acipenser sinensis]
MAVIERAIETQGDTFRDLVKDMLAEALGTVREAMQDTGVLLRSMRADLDAHGKAVEKVTAKMDTLKGDMRQVKKETIALTVWRHSKTNLMIWKNNQDAATCLDRVLEQFQLPATDCVPKDPLPRWRN